MRYLKASRIGCRINGRVPLYLTLGSTSIHAVCKYSQSKGVYDA